MPAFTSTQLQQLKLEAKNQSRKSGIPRHQALDELAHAKGFSNWALLMKNAAPEEQSQHYRFIRSDEDMRAALRKVPGAVASPPGRNVPSAIDVPDIWDKFNSPQEAVDFAIEYMTTILRVPRYKVSLSSKAFWEMRLWLPYGFTEVTETTQILVNRYYKPVGVDSKPWVKYEDYTKLITSVSAKDKMSFSHSDEGNGFLYGLSPWRSRQAAEDYLARLKALKSMFVRLLDGLTRSV